MDTNFLEFPCCGQGDWWWSHTFNASSICLDANAVHVSLDLAVIQVTMQWFVCRKFNSPKYPLLEGFQGNVGSFNEILETSIKPQGQ